MKSLFFEKFENVSRETYDQIEYFLSLLHKWNSVHNIIRSTELNANEFFNRHVVDSFQLVDFLKQYNSILDVGSGNGFPGIILAIAGLPVTLIEKDQKKCVFLKWVLSSMSLPNKVISENVYNYHDPYDVVVSRGFSELTNLIHVQKNVSRETKKADGIYLKGKDFLKEIEKAKEMYDFIWEGKASLSSFDGMILKITLNID